MVDHVDLDFECTMKCAQIEFEAKYLIENLERKCRAEIEKIPAHVKNFTIRQLYAEPKEEDIVQL